LLLGDFHKHPARHFIFDAPGLRSKCLETQAFFQHKWAFIPFHSSALASTYHQVHQCLADLIRLADVMLLRGDNALDKESAMTLIESLKQGIKVLLGPLLF
jgi:hypothetical protein